MTFHSTVISADMNGLVAGHYRSASIENPAVDINNPTDLDFAVFGAEASDAGVRVGHKGALKYGPWWRGVNLLASTVAKLPLYVYRSSDDDTREKFKNHAAYKLLRRKPNTEMNAFTFLQTVQGHALTKGNGYAYILRDERDGRPLEVIPLNPLSTYPVRVDGVLWYVTPVNGRNRKLEPTDVLHIKGLGFDGLVGYDVVTMARNSVGLGLAGEKFGSNFFKNAAKPSCWIEVPKKLTPEAAKKLAASWERIHSGINNSHRTAVFEEGAKVNPFSFNAAESQLLEMRKFQIVDIANFLGCPVSKLGGEGRTAYASLESENQAFLDEGLDPWLCAWEHECNDKLLTEEEKNGETAYFEFNRNALVRANMADRYAAYSIALGGRPFATQNEVRRKENMKPIEGGDVVLEPLNMGKIGFDPNAKAKGKEKKSLADQVLAELRARGISPRRSRREDPTRRASRDRAVTPPNIPDDVTRRLLVDCLGRMARRLGTHARRAVKEPRKFNDWLDGLAGEHRETIVAACDAAVGVVNAAQAKVDRDRTGRVADRLLTAFRDELNTVTGLATAAELATAVDRSLTSFETAWPETSADAILKGEF